MATDTLISDNSSCQQTGDLLDGEKVPLGVPQNGEMALVDFAGLGAKRRHFPAGGVPADHDLAGYRRPLDVDIEDREEDHDPVHLAVTHGVVGDGVDPCDQTVGRGDEDFGRPIEGPGRNAEEEESPHRTDGGCQRPPGGPESEKSQSQQTGGQDERERLFGKRHSHEQFGETPPSAASGESCQG
jgi:hypothetical protein